MRSRTGSLPRSRWRSIERSSPPAPRPATVRLAAPQVVDQRGHRVVVGARLGGGGVEPAAQDGHGRDDRSLVDAEPRSSSRSSRGHVDDLDRVLGLALLLVSPSRRCSSRAGRLVRPARTGRSSPSRRAAASARTVRAGDGDPRTRRNVHAAAKPPNDLGTVPPDAARGPRRGDRRRPTSRPCSATRSRASARPPFDGQEFIFEFGAPGGTRAARDMRGRHRLRPAALRGPLDRARPVHRPADDLTPTDQPVYQRIRGRLVHGPAANVRPRRMPVRRIRPPARASDRGRRNRRRTAPGPIRTRRASPSPNPSQKPAIPAR